MARARAGAGGGPRGLCRGSATRRRERELGRIRPNRGGRNFLFLFLFIFLFLFLFFLDPFFF
jgi:hypothetical protein